MRNTRNIPWLRIVSEGLAIVVSILMAFGIDAWWQGRSDRKLFQSSVQNFQRELDANLNALQESRDRHYLTVDSGKALLATADDELDSEAFYGHVYKVFFMASKTDYSTGALAVLLNPVFLEYLSGIGLETMVTALPAQILDAVEDEQWAIEFINQELTPYLNRTLPVASITEFASDHWYETLSGSFELGADDLAAILNSREFQNMVVSRVTYEWESIREMDELQKILVALKDSIPPLAIQTDA